MRMLVVDDEEAIANMLVEFFRMEGYEVASAGSGAAALEAVSSGLRPDIILLDVNMPGMDGFEVCRRIRAHLSCPIIFFDGAHRGRRSARRIRRRCRRLRAQTVFA